MAKRQEAAKAKKTAVSPKKPKAAQKKPKEPAKKTVAKPAAASKTPAKSKSTPPKKDLKKPAAKGVKPAVPPKKKAVVAAKPAAKPTPKTTAKPAPKPAKKAVPAPVKKPTPPKGKPVASVKKPVVPAPKKAVKPAKPAPAVQKPAPKPAKPVAKAPEKPVKKVAAPPAKPVKPAPLPPTTAVKAAKEPVAPPPPPKDKKAVPPIPVSFLVDLARTIKEAVEESARAVKGREVVSHAESGDVTFQLDKMAEKALLTYLKRAGKPVAYYSEDAGYSTFTSEKPKHLLVVDPIDGSRAAKSGFEGCVVAVASTRVIERPTMADVDNAVVLELLGDRCFQAERGKGVKITAGGQSRRVKLSANAELRTMIWSMTVPGRPAELVFPTVARLIDHSSLEGGFFACNSTAHSLTRLLTNQLDACVDIANRYYRDIPDRVQRLFENAGQGRVIGIAPYDLAAALLVAQEAGCTVTDAYGKSFNDVLLLDSTASNHLSLVAAANKELHAKLMEFLQKRIGMIEGRFQAMPTA